MDDSENKIIVQQKEVCLKYQADFLFCPLTSIIGVALDTFNNLKLPVNGLRHSIEAENFSGWYIWAGEYSSASDFFKPVHIKHLIEICPDAIKYLGLAPGWRFLFDSHYEDVWHDEKLLIII